MARPVFVLLGLFLASLFILLLGYGSDSTGLGRYDPWAFLQEVPALRLAAMMTLICPAILLVAFWESRGDVGRFHNATLGWSIIVPLPALLLILTRDVYQVQFDVTIFAGCVVTSQGVAARLLRDWVWVRGQRRVAP